jgi:hypothetical protein
MGGAVPPLPQHAFMASCSVRGSTGATLPFTLLGPLLSSPVSIMTLLSPNTSKRLVSYIKLFIFSYLFHVEMFQNICFILKILLVCYYRRLIFVGKR